MGERKVLNKYYPPDFDPAEIVRRKGARKEQIKVRMMLPMSIQCNTCGNFIYKGTKFNSRKEDAAGETYLGIQVVRLYIKCTKCSAEISLKTDPKNSDYILEAGATRNYEPWRDAESQLDKARAQREAEEEGNAMKALENKTMDSKREIDILNALDEIRAMNAKQNKLTPEEILAAIRKKGEEDDQTFGAEEDLDAVAAAEFQRQTAALTGFVRRLESSSDEEGDGAKGAAKRPKRDPLAADPLGGGAGAGPGPSAAAADGAAGAKGAGRPAAFAWSAPQRKPVVLVKKKEAPAAAAAATAQGGGAAGAAAAGGGAAAAASGGGGAAGSGGLLAGLLGGYASSDSIS